MAGVELRFETRYHFVTVHLRHHHVADDEVVVVLLCFFKTCCTIVTNLYLEVLFHLFLEELAHVDIVLNDENVLVVEWSHSFGINFDVRTLARKHIVVHLVWGSQSIGIQ